MRLGVRISSTRFTRYQVPPRSERRELRRRDERIALLEAQRERKNASADAGGRSEGHTVNNGRKGPAANGRP